MQNPDRNTIKISNIIPFSPRKANQKNVSVTTIATIMAVSVLHSDDENPEDKLMELIESSGEVEILDALLFIFCRIHHRASFSSNALECVGKVLVLT